MRGTNKHNIVMIADDDLFVRKVISTALKDLAEIVEATDGKDVQSLYEKHMPDILFLDVHLPNISGLDLIRVLLKFDSGANIIMMSSDSRTNNVSTAKLRGSKGFLAKPFDKKRILHFFNTSPTVKFT